MKLRINYLMFKAFGVGLAGFGSYIALIGVDMLLSKPVFKNEK